MATLRHRIEAARAYADISSQKKLAERVEMDPTTFKRWLNQDLGRFTRPYLLAIAEACDVPIWFLEFGWKGATAQVDEAIRRSADWELGDASPGQPSPSGKQPQESGGDESGKAA